MIKTENGHTTLNGTGAELLADYTCAGVAIKNAFEGKGMPTKRVRELLDDCVNDAFKATEVLEGDVETALWMKRRLNLRNCRPWLLKP